MTVTGSPEIDRTAAGGSSAAARQPLLSIITVVRNDAARLAATARSVREQSPAAFEWVVVDGASTDATQGVIDENAGWIAASVSEPDRGIFDAMNKGVGLATGSFVHFLNAGDAFAGPSCAAAICEALESTAADVLAFAALDVFADGLVAARHPAPVQEILWHRLPTGHQALVTRRSLMLHHAFDLRYRVCADYAALASQYVAGAIVQPVDRPIVRYDRSASAFSVVNWRLMAAEHWQVQRDLLGEKIHRRALSMAKRLLSLAMVRALAIPILSRPARALARRAYGA